MKIMTCNIRFSSMGGDSGPRLWANRRELCFDAISRRDPDILCLQECHNDQFRDFTAAFGAEYDAFHGNSYPGDYFPENAVFYRRSLFRNLGCGAWHLSEKPHVCGSKSWNSECVRFVNWLLLCDGSGRQFRVINTHFDHASQLSREKSAEMVNEDSSVWDPALPQILTGDLNCDPDNQAIKILESAGWRDTLLGDDRWALTCHEFNGPESRVDYGICGKGRMDYVFLRGPAAAGKTEIVRDSRNGVWPSDHYFVFSEITFAEQK
ncbi:MAG: endonuclease/exonuclease/phosphatase family protein [Lentisphaeria bacterium]|nr:endonuclease/exonuclease/phosphatase family protein [Lentisphaeria bacterium]